MTCTQALAVVAKKNWYYTMSSCIETYKVTISSLGDHTSWILPNYDMLRKVLPLNPSNQIRRYWREMTGIKRRNRWSQKMQNVQEVRAQQWTCKTLPPKSSKKRKKKDWKVIVTLYIDLQKCYNLRYFIYEKV